MKPLLSIFILAILASVGFAQETSTAENQPLFRHDVLPVLSKLGCNSGACHGALAGKGGFRLSLHGYDPQSDFSTLHVKHEGDESHYRIPVGVFY